MKQLIAPTKLEKFGLQWAKGTFPLSCMSGRSDVVSSLVQKKL